MQIKCERDSTRVLISAGAVVIKAPRFRALLAGVRANQNEYEQWKIFPRRLLVPTIGSVGFINIQRRGKDVTQEELNLSHPFRELLEDMPSELVAEMTRPENFCWHDERICLVNYGSSQAFEFFSIPQPQSVVLELANMIRD